MKLRLSRIFLVLAMASAFAAVSQVSGQTVTGSIAGGTVTRGKAAKATITLTIPSELHVNSNKPNSEYQIPTTVKLAASGITLGRVTYPPGHNRKFEFSEQELNIYDGRVKFGFTVTVPVGYKGKTISVKATVRYQACTNEVCYPPKNKEVTLTARVK